MAKRAAAPTQADSGAVANRTSRKQVDVASLLGCFPSRRAIFPHRASIGRRNPTGFRAAAGHNDRIPQRAVSVPAPPLPPEGRRLREATVYAAGTPARVPLARSLVTAPTDSVLPSAYPFSGYRCHMLRGAGAPRPHRPRSGRFHPGQKSPSAGGRQFPRDSNANLVAPTALSLFLSNEHRAEKPFPEASST